MSWPLNISSILVLIFLINFLHPVNILFIDEIIEIGAIIYTHIVCLQ